MDEAVFTTENILVKSYERYSFAYTDVRSMRALASSFAQTKEIYAANILNGTVETTTAVSLPAALAIGAAAVIIRNPDISRRGIFSWWSES